MSADSLLRYLAEQTRYYDEQTQGEKAQQQQRETIRQQSVLAQLAADQKRGAELSPNDPRNSAVLAEDARYSEAKLQEQRGGGLAASGNAYSDMRLREQLGMPSAEARPAHPLENYLGGVQSQEQYRPAMLQYLASGGKRPNWFTGNFAQDKPQIEAAISATMTPKEQMIRQEAQQGMLYQEEARQARLQLAKDVELRRAQEAAQKREGVKAKSVIPNRDDRLQALQVLGGLVGEAFETMPLHAQEAAAAKAASIAKAKVGTPEAEGVDFESLLSDAYNEMITKGELRMPEAGSFFPPKLPKGAEFRPGGSQSSQPAATRGNAPANAIEYLKTHPELKEQFRAKYGYLP